MASSRRDVSAWVQSRQSFVDGAHIIGRFRCRRRSRDAGKHRSAYGRRRRRDGGRAQRLARNRIHDRIDDRFVGGRLYPRPFHERHSRPAVSRIRDHDQRGDSGFRPRVSNANADAGKQCMCVNCELVKAELIGLGLGGFTKSDLIGDDNPVPNIASNKRVTSLRVRKQ